MRLSEPSRKRLVILCRLLQQEIEANNTALSAESESFSITSKRISELTGWTDATIRRDISLLGIRCGAAKGYNAESLLAAIKAVVTTAATATGRSCCLVGLGRIGAALIDYEGFALSGMELAAGFDDNVNRVEILNASFPLYPASRLEQVVRQEVIRYAVLTVPDDKANSYARRLAAAGIKGIVNCTGAVLTVPADVAVENASVAHALQNLLATT